MKDGIVDVTMIVIVDRHKLSGSNCDPSRRPKPLPCRQCSISCSMGTGEARWGWTDRDDRGVEQGRRSQVSRLLHLQRWHSQAIDGAGDPDLAAPLPAPSPRAPVGTLAVAAGSGATAAERTVPALALARCREGGSFGDRMRECFPQGTRTAKDEPL